MCCTSTNSFHTKRVLFTFLGINKCKANVLILLQFGAKADLFPSINLFRRRVYWCMETMFMIFSIYAECFVSLCLLGMWYLCIAVTFYRKNVFWLLISCQLYSSFCNISIHSFGAVMRERLCCSSTDRRICCCNVWCPAIKCRKTDVLFLSTIQHNAEIPRHILAYIYRDTHKHTRCEDCAERARTSYVRETGSLCLCSDTHLMTPNLLLSWAQAKYNESPSTHIHSSI